MNELFLSYCSVSPLHPSARRGMSQFDALHAERGVLMFETIGDPLRGFKKAAASLLKVKSCDISFLRSTAEGLCLIANGYPFSPGDEIISYIHEYPANYYPWVLQEKTRGVVLTLLPNRACGLAKGGEGSEVPCGWSFEELVKSVSKRTKIIALSHVQFTSGFAADLKQLGAFCQERDIDLIIDAAQSLGSLPLYPEEWGIAAVAASGWKWLMGALGSGVLYTTPRLREKLAHTMVGAELMKQGMDYLDHTWNPQEDGRRFEYSTVPYSGACGLQAVIDELFVTKSMEEVREDLFAKQDYVIDKLRKDRFSPQVFKSPHRSGIVTISTAEEAPALAQLFRKQDVVLTARGAGLRLAPHVCTSYDELDSALEVLNS